MRYLAGALLVLAGGATLIAQDIQVSRQNRTISVTADASATSDAEVAVLAIGYHNFAPTQEAAFQENVRVADQVQPCQRPTPWPRRWLRDWGHNWVS